MRRPAVRLVLFIAAAVLVIVGVEELAFNRSAGLWEGIACFAVALVLGIAGVLLRPRGGPSQTNRKYDENQIK